MGNRTEKPAGTTARETCSTCLDQVQAVMTGIAFDRFTTLGFAAILLVMLSTPAFADADEDSIQTDEPFIQTSEERFAIVTAIRLIANPRTGDSARERHLDELADLIADKHESVKEAVLLINWIFDDYRYRCRNRIVRSTINRLNEIEIFQTSYHLQFTCNNRARDQGIRTIVQLEDLSP